MGFTTIKILSFKYEQKASKIIQFLSKKQALNNLHVSCEKRDQLRILQVNL